MFDIEQQIPLLPLATSMYAMYLPPLHLMTRVTSMHMCISDLTAQQLLPIASRLKKLTLEGTNMQDWSLLLSHCSMLEELELHYPRVELSDTSFSLQHLMCRHLNLTDFLNAWECVTKFLSVSPKLKRITVPRENTPRLWSFVQGAENAGVEELDFYGGNEFSNEEDRRRQKEFKWVFV